MFGKCFCKRGRCAQRNRILFFFFFLLSDNFVSNVSDERFSNANVIMPTQILSRPFEIMKFLKIVCFFVEPVAPTLPHPLCEKRDPNKVARGKGNGVHVILFSRDPLAAPIVNLFPRAAWRRTLFSVNADFRSGQWWRTFFGSTFSD